MGPISSNNNPRDYITINNLHDKTIEDEEPLRQIQQSIQINPQHHTKRLIKQQNYLYPQGSTQAMNWKKNIRIDIVNEFTELKISPKGILKSPNSHPHTTKNDKKVTFKKSQIKEEKYFRSHRKKKHKVTLKDLEQLF